MAEYSFATDDVFPSQDELEVQESWVDRVVVLAAVGTVDLLTAPQLNEAIAAAAAKSPAGLIIDLSKVDFLATAGISVLVTARTNVTPTARFGVVADGPATSRPITLLGIEITLFRTLDDALHDFSSA
jgi:anti-sigma B factor antagonist